MNEIPNSNSANVIKYWFMPECDKIEIAIM